MSGSELVAAGRGDLVRALVAISGGYALGCLNAAYYAVFFRSGKDIRHLGSGSAGATNAGRLLGTGGFLMVLLLDAAKGAAAVALACWLTDDPRVTILGLWAVVAGHIWPVQLGFRGGKGVATSIGGLLVYHPWVVLVLAVVFVSIWVLLRRFVLSGLLGLAACPLVLLAFGADALDGVGVAAVVAAVWVAHRDNLRAEYSRSQPGPEASRDRRGPTDGGFQ